MLIGDTNESSFIMTDDEVDAALSLNGDDVFAAAADCCRAIAASAAKSAIAYSLLGSEMRVDKKSVPRYYLELADKYDAKAGSTDTEDYMVEWPLLVEKVTGYDDSDYASDDDANYFQTHYEDGDA